MINGELIVDNFAGGGGASTGIELATGYSVDIAINHDPEAIRMHQTNHPNTKHYCEDVWMVDPVKVCNGRPVGLAWFSPDCKHFSKAKGGKPKDKNIRGLAWVACRWAGLVRPRVIMLENVEEFKGCKLEATYAGKTPYQYDVISAKSFHASTVSLLGRKNPVTDVSISPKELSKSPQNITVTYGDMSVSIPVKAIKADHIAWSYADGPIYEGDSFHPENISAELIYADNTKKELAASDFELTKTPEILTADDHTVTAKTILGEEQYEIPRNTISKLTMESKELLYEGDYPKSDFSYEVTYSDDEKKELSVDDVEIPDTIPLAAGNNDISVTYLGKEYTSTITATQKTAAVVAAETYKTELDNSVSNVTTDSIFVSVQQKYTESGEYFLTHIIVNDPSSQVKGGLSNDSWGGYREYPTTYAGRTGAAVTTNGSYFSYDSGQPVCAGCFIKGGKILKDGVTNGKEICLDNTGKFYTPSAGISASTLLASGVKDIWGTADPLLIQDGQKVDLANQQKINNTYYNRTAIGMVQPGEYYMITAGTAQYKNGLSFAELQSIFANLGCTYARSMDGGGSSSLVVNGKLLNTPAQYDERPVVDFLSFLP